MRGPLKNFALLMIVAMVCGCATDASRVVEYRYVAYSWTDGNIGDMIEAWGTPRAGYKNAADSDPGYARWRAFSRVGGAQGDDSIRYHCDTIARFGADGTISKIEIRASKHCQRHYRDLGSMLRPGVKPPPDAN